MLFAWCLESKWRNCGNLWCCLAELPLAEFDPCIGKRSQSRLVTYLPIVINYKVDLQHKRRGSGSGLFLYRHKEGVAGRIYSKKKKVSICLLSEGWIKQ